MNEAKQSKMRRAVHDHLKECTECGQAYLTLFETVAMHVQVDRRRFDIDVQPTLPGMKGRS